MKLPEASVLMVVPGQYNTAGKLIQTIADIDDPGLLLTLKCVRLLICTLACVSFNHDLHFGFLPMFIHTPPTWSRFWRIGGEHHGLAGEGVVKDLFPEGGWDACRRHHTYKALASTRGQICVGLSVESAKFVSKPCLVRHFFSCVAFSCVAFSCVCGCLPYNPITWHCFNNFDHLPCLQVGKEHNERVKRSLEYDTKLRNCRYVYTESLKLLDM